MNNKDFTVLAQRLSPEIVGFAVKAPLMLIPPVQHTVRGISFEGSSFDAKSFYVSFFLQPLFVPANHVSLTLGSRLRTPGGGDRWNSESPAIIHDLATALKDQALPFLLPVETPRDVAQAAMSLRLPQNPHVQQAIAYALARAGDLHRAVTELEALMHLLDIKIAWQSEMAERAQDLKAKLLTRPADAQRQLETWENESAKNLGLDNFRRNAPLE